MNKLCCFGDYNANVGVTVRIHTQEGITEGESILKGKRMESDFSYLTSQGRIWVPINTGLVKL